MSMIPFHKPGARRVDLEGSQPMTEDLESGNVSTAGATNSVITPEREVKQETTT